MTLDRRAFLRRSTVAIAGGLLLGDEALAAFERLTHRKVFALGALPSNPASGIVVTTDFSFASIPAATWRKVNHGLADEMAAAAVREEWEWVDT